VESGSPSNPVDTEASCSVPRNDVQTQVYQPTPRQVEWAADQAVVGSLTMTRPANWKQAGMGSSWSPQGLFPPIPAAAFRIRAPAGSTRMSVTWMPGGSRVCSESITRDPARCSLGNDDDCRQDGLAASVQLLGSLSCQVTNGET
jgi:hypothetical protein